MNYNVTVLPGDGIGPEITSEAVKVLKAVGEKYGHRFDLEYGPIGAFAMEAGLPPYPDETHEMCIKSDAVLFGAIGDPAFDHQADAGLRPESGLLKMREALGLYANIRPVSIFEALSDLSPLRKERIKDADLVIVRELTGGIYFGTPRGRDEEGKVAYDTCVYRREEIERVSRIGFEMAMQRKKKLCLVDKANVLATSRLWRECVQEMSTFYPEVLTDYLFVDNAAMQLIQDPSQFDVILTENMFGDILSDEASVISGSIGLLPSASIGGKLSLYEPIHGSYPQAKGKGIANPIATILSLSMMLDLSFKLIDEARMLKTVVKEALEKQIGTPDIFPEKSYSTQEVGSWICNKILE